MALAPIILFAYNRPHYMRTTLIALQQNELAKQSELIIYCDGPKTNATTEDLNKIKAVRQLALEKDWCGKVQVVEVPANKGLAQSIVMGVTDTVNKYGKVIVMEDDLVVGPYFLAYMNDALAKYENNDMVASVSGHNFPIDFDKELPGRETFFLNSTTTWGWATWQRAWKIYNHDAAFLLDQIKSRGLKKELDFNNTYPYFSMLQKAVAGKVQSWGIRWYTSVFLQQKLTIFPYRSLVKNIGADGTNVKVNNSNFTGEDIYNKPITRFEEKVEEDKVFRKLYIQYFNEHNRRKITLKNLRYYSLRIMSMLKSKFRK